MDLRSRTTPTRLRCWLSVTVRPNLRLGVTFESEIGAALVAKKSKSGPEIPRDDYVYGNTTDVVSALTVRFDSMGGVSIDEIASATIRRQLSHVRARKDKGDKVIVSVPANDFSLSRSHFEELKSRFDYLAAVDTNTIADINGPVRLAGYAVSACTISVIAEALSTLHSEIRFQPLASYLILDTAAAIKHEPLGWHLALKHMDTPFLRCQRLGMIVDSDLGKHLGINSQKLPYFGNHVLPTNTSLIYASADRSDTLPNQMIKYSDNIAGQVLTHFKKNGIDLLLQEPSSKIGTALYYLISHTKL